MLHLHRSHRADALVETLAGILAPAPDDPFTRELVAVPTRGMERWVTQRLSHHLGTGGGVREDGVCAAVDFPAPGRLIREALAAGSRIDPDRDPWNAERLVWPLMQVSGELLDEPWLAPLAHHLAGGETRRYSRLAHLAGLYEHYALHRPEMVLAWAEGAGGDHWQPELWRRVRERVDIPSVPERLARAREALVADPDLVDLPGRLALFGLTRIARAHLQILDALAVGREVHLLILHPSPALWDEIAAADGAAAPVTRAEDRSGVLVRNRLLASWGRDARELQLMLAETGGGAISIGEATPGGAVVVPDAAVDESRTPLTLLGALQADVRADRAPPGPPLAPGDPDHRRRLAADDDSIRIHACHGRARQVAVLREAIMHRLAADPSLEPRDIIVMCPDVEEFAPLIQAAFGNADGAEGDLRVRLADRGLRQTNPMLGLAARLLELSSARLTASEVLDLLDSDPVRRRLNLGDDDIGRIRSWVVEARIHWGLDPTHRAAWKLGAVEAGTWLRGIRRLLLSAAMAEEGAVLFRGALPAGAVDSADITLVGTLAEFVDRIAETIDALAGPHPLVRWAGALADAVDALGMPDPREAWQREELASLLDGLVADGGGAGDLQLTRGEARAVLSQRLRGRPTRANFRTGHLTVCTLHPMRSIPHRVVCLLGLDDGAFPRHAPRDGDDLLAADPHVGDRDPRAEDRQLLLDALMAAQDALLITFSGNDERTNAPLPPAVPVGELIDAIEATAVTASGESAVERVLVRHPLQAFDPRNFCPGDLGISGPWSFDATSLAGARALLAAPGGSGGSGGAAGSAASTDPLAPGGVLPVPLDPPTEERIVALDDLITFMEHPARAFLRQRLGVSVRRWDDEIDDGLPVGLSGLERYGVGQRMLEAVLAGAAWKDAIQAELARGTLPPGTLGQPIIDAAHATAQLITAQVRVYLEADPRTYETNLALEGDRRLSGTVSGVRGSVVLNVAFSRLGPRQRLGAWVRLCAISAAHPDTAWEALSVGRAPSGGGVAIARISPLAGTEDGRARAGREELTRLIALRQEGLSRPLVAPARTAAAFVAAHGEGGDAAAAARAEWTSGYGRFGAWIEREDSDAEHQLVFGPELPLDGVARDAWRLWEALRSRERLERV